MKNQKNLNDNEDQDLDYETASDETSKKIKRLEHEIKAVSSSEDKKLFIWIAFIIIAILIHQLLPSRNTQLLVLFVVPISIVIGISTALYQNIRRKKKILIKHGLQCKACGYIPSTFYASGLFHTKKCMKCRADLQI